MKVVAPDCRCSIEGINLNPVKISDSPLRVLNHLYYYAVQYGLSAAQYTGKHQNYWRDLPKRLREALGSATRLREIVVELEAIAADYDRRHIAKQNQRRGWCQKEIVLSAQLSSVLCALPDRLIASTFQHLTKAASIPTGLRVVGLKIAAQKRQDRDFVEPDLLLTDNHMLVMVEVKTRGASPKGHSYPPSQLRNYLRLAAEIEAHKSGILPDRFAHVIIVPSNERLYLLDHEKYVSAITDGKVEINEEAFVRLLGRKLDGPYARIRPMLAIVPIYYRSWHDLAAAYGDALKENDLGQYETHLQRLGGELTELAQRASRYAMSEESTDGEVPSLDNDSVRGISDAENDAGRRVRRGGSLPRRSRPR